MKLDKTLNFKKVRCVKGYDDCLEIGKEYNVIDIGVEIKVKDDRGELLYWESDHFEPVIESAENPLQDAELTPEFEAVEPKFKVGDKAYYGNRRYLLEIIEIRGCMVRVRNGNYLSDAHINYLCHATQENYERLQATFPHIDFEQPPKPLTGSDLARAMLDKGWKFVPCYVHDVSDDEAIDRKHYATVENKNPTNGYSFISTGETDWKYAVPIDPRTGEPLTEAVLDE